MLKHIVFFQFSSTVSSETISQTMNGFAQLSAEIPEILSYSWGYNNSTEGLSKGFQAGFEMLLSDEAARQRYLEHPAHVAFATTKLIPLLADGRNSIVVFDFDQPSKFALGVNLGGPAVNVAGNPWLSYDEARGSVLDVGNAQDVTAVVPPVPVALAETTTMLSSGIYGDELHLKLKVANGRYHLFLWVLENWRTNHRAMNFLVGTELVAQNVGSFEKGQWNKFGPYLAVVQDGQLRIDVENPRKDTAHMHLMGLELFSL
jgi:hypothetical protein